MPAKGSKINYALYLYIVCHWSSVFFYWCHSAAFYCDGLWSQTSWKRKRVAVIALCLMRPSRTVICFQAYALDFNCDNHASAPTNSHLKVVVQSPTPFGLGRNGCWPFWGSHLPQALPFIFSLCCPLYNRSRAAHSFFKIGCLFSLILFSCSSLALLRLFILLLLLMSGNVHPNPGAIFPCSVCAGNVTWRGKSVQCCTCSKWVHLRCSQLSLSKFRALGSSHSWSCPSCRNTVTPPSNSSDMYTSTVQSDPPLLMLHFRPILVSKPLVPICPFYIFSLCPLTTVPCSWLSFCTSCLLSFPGSLRVLQWNAGCLWARSTELLHFLSSHPVDLICIQESNLNSCSSFGIPGLSALHSDCTHSQSGILSPDAMHASDSVVFLSGRAYLFLNFLPALFLCSIPTLIM